MGKKEDGNENVEIISPVRENKPNSKTDSKIECITAIMQYTIITSNKKY